VIVLDASALIAHLDRDDSFHEAAEELLLARAEDRFAASTTSIAEVLVGPARAGRLAEAERALRRLEVEEVGLGEGAAVRLAGLRASTGLRLPDCCTLLATESMAGEVATFDRRLASAARMLGLAVEGA
jgi:predicted nucleic acid-binding protein